MSSLSGMPVDHRRHVRQSWTVFSFSLLLFECKYHMKNLHATRSELVGGATHYSWCFALLFSINGGLPFNLMFCSSFKTVCLLSSRASSPLPPSCLSLSSAISRAWWEFSAEMFLIIISFSFFRVYEKKFQSSLRCARLWSQFVCSLFFLSLWHRQAKLNWWIFNSICDGGARAGGSSGRLTKWAEFLLFLCRVVKRREEK